MWRIQSAGSKWVNECLNQNMFVQNIVLGDVVTLPYLIDNAKSLLQSKKADEAFYT